MRNITTIGLSVAVLAATGWLAQASAQSAAPDQSAPPAASDTSTPAPADSTAPAPKKHMHHHMKSSSKMAPKKADAGDAAVDDLNAKSLSDAKAGTSFAPPTKTPPEKAPMKKSMPMKHHMHKKPAPKPADAPAPDASK